MSSPSYRSSGPQWTEPGSQPSASAAPRQKSRWWLWLLIAAGSLLLLAIIAVIGGFLYFRSLVTHYTAPAPKVFPKVEFTDAQQKEFENRWTEFARAVQARQTPEPFIITADDLNLAISKIKELRDHVRVVITNSQALVEFSFPLDQAGLQSLQGLHINGVAKLSVVFKNGWLDVNVGSVDVNGRPLPGFLLKRLRQENLGKALDQNKSVVNALQGVESIKVEGSSIVVTPAAPK
jgi:hypothetical protein